VKKIAIIYNTSYYLYLFRRNLIAELLNEGFEVHCIALEDTYTQFLRDMGCSFTDVSVGSNSQSPLQDMLYCRKLYRTLKVIKPDLVLNYTAKPLVYGTLSAKAAGIPVINNIGGLGIGFTEKNIVTRILIFLYKISQRKADVVFFQNPDDMELFRKNNMFKEGHAFLLPGSGVDLQNFAFKPLVKKDKIIFVLIARMLYSKGVIHLLEAGDLLMKKGFSNFEIRLVGEFGVKNKDCIPLSEKEKWQKYPHVRFIDKVDDVKPFLQEADCMVLPSYYREGTPRSVLEALSVGRPVITSNMPGCRETVIEGFNGYICEPHDVEGLADAMGKILLASFEDLEIMGKNSRQMAEEKYDEKIIFNAYKKQIGIHIINK
jgi:glycosyltransferase involved in cell wall biosynthesis